MDDITRTDLECTSKLVYGARLILLEGVKQESAIQYDMEARRMLEEADNLLQELQDYLISQY